MIPSGVDEIDTPAVEETEGTVPSRLTIGSIGGLKLRTPAKSLPYLNYFVYGPTGAGKTLLAGSSAFVEEMSPVLFIDIEGGTHTLNHFETDQIFVVPDPEAQRPLRWDDLQNIYDDLYRGKHPFKTVVIDSLSECQRLALADGLGAGVGKVEFDEIGKIPEFKEWRVNTEQLRRMVRAFRDLPINTIFTALDGEIEDERSRSDKPQKLIVPDFPPRLRKEIPAFFDLVFYMYSKARGSVNERFIQTDRDNVVVAKCRIPGVPMHIKSPTMEMLYDLLIRHPGTPIIDSQPTAGGMMKKKSKSEPEN
jgi:hypothetical protein